MTSGTSISTRLSRRLDAGDLGLVSLVVGYVSLILVGFAIGNPFLILDGAAILFGLFIFLAAIIVFQTIRPQAKPTNLKLSDTQFVIFSLSILGSLATSLWIFGGAGGLYILGLFFTPIIVGAIFITAFRNDKKRQSKSD